MAERMQVFLTPDGLEVDVTDHFEIRRQRVFFDEVQLVLLHRQRGGGPVPWVFAGLAAMSGLMALPFSFDSDLRNGCLAVASVFALFAAAGFTLTSRVVTVYGKRARARIRYWRAGKAHEVYEEICRAAAAAQPPRSEALPPPLPPSSPSGLDSPLRAFDPLGDDRGDVGPHPVE